MTFRKLKKLTVLPAVFLVFMVGGCKEDPVTQLCDDPMATNYNQPGECIYDSSGIIYGCTDPDALNYDALANFNNGSCLYGSTAGFVTLDFKAILNNMPFVLTDSIYKNVMDYFYKIETIKFYLSNIYLIKADNSEVLVEDVAYLNFEDHHRMMSSEGEEIRIPVPVGDYTGIRFGVGLDSTLNFSDPAIYPSNHPLSILNNNYWTWNTGYIFLKLEGRADTIPNGNKTFPRTFLYHCGTLPLYRELTFDENFSISVGSEYKYNLALNVDKLFYHNADTLDVKEEFFTHTTGDFALAEKVTDLFVNAIEERP